MNYLDDILVTGKLYPRQINLSMTSETPNSLEHPILVQQSVNSEDFNEGSRTQRTISTEGFHSAQQLRLLHR